MSETPIMRCQGDSEYRERKKLLPGEARGQTNAGRRLLSLRTQAQVADMLGITRQAVTQAERSALWKIRRRLKATYKELLTG